MACDLIQGLVSVIVPAYNNAQYLRRCVDSILVQTYRQIEVIVVDDGSDDNPQDVLTDIDDARFRGIVRLRHSGVSTVRNAGIQHARGEFMVFVDGDDWVEPDHIAVLVDGLSEADCAMIMMSIDYPDRRQVNKELISWIEHNPVIFRNGFSLLFEKYLLSSPCNKIYRTQLVKYDKFLQFDPSVSYAEDLLFNLEYFKSINSVSFSTKATYHYVKHPNSGTARYHRDTAYTLKRLSVLTSELFGKPLTQGILTVLMRHYLWGLSNVHHQNAPLSSAQVRNEIRLILAIPEYQAAKTTLSDIGISSKMQMLLRIGNAILIHECFKFFR